MSSYTRGWNEVKVGLLVLLGIGVFTALFMFLTDRGIGLHRSDLHIRLPMAERVRKGDAVIFLGVPVGEVRSVGFAPDSGVVVEARLKRPIPLRASATATLTTLDMIGGQVIILKNDGPESGPLLADGDTIRGRAEPSIMERIDQIGERFSALTSDTMTSAIVSTVGGASGAMSQLNHLLRNVNGALDEHGEDVRQVVSDLVELTRRLEGATTPAEIREVVEQIKNATRHLEQTAVGADSAFASTNEILRSLQNGEGTLGKLLTSSELHNESLAAVRALNALATDVKQNPKRYINVSVF